MLLEINILKIKLEQISQIGTEMDGRCLFKTY